MLAAAQDGPVPVEAVRTFGVGNAPVFEEPDFKTARFGNPYRRRARLYRSGNFGFDDSAFFVRLVKGLPEVFTVGYSGEIEKELALAEGNFQGFQMHDSGSS